MATTKTAKKTVAAPAKAPEKAITVTAAANAAAPAEPSTLTIVVVDGKSQPVSGANISIDPSATKGVTDSSGTYEFPIGNYPKYDITASYGSNSATVPYYVTPDGATRLVINPVYIKAVGQQRSGSSFVHVAEIGGVAIVVALIVFAAWKIFRHPK